MFGITMVAITLRLLISARAKFSSSLRLPFNSASLSLSASSWAISVDDRRSVLRFRLDYNKLTVLEGFFLFALFEFVCCD